MDPSRPVESTAIFTVKGSTAAAKVESYVATYDRGQEKVVAIAGGEGSWF